MLDPNGYVMTWNVGAERIKGFLAQEIIGQHFSRFYPQDAVQGGWPEHELQVAAEQGRFEDEGWRVRKDGSQFWANVVITALRDEEGRLRGFAKLTRDLTERKRAETLESDGAQREELLEAERNARIAGSSARASKTNFWPRSRTSCALRSTPSSAGRRSCERSRRPALMTCNAEQKPSSATRAHRCS